MTKIPALVVTFNPNFDLAQKLDSLYQEFDEIILVDNGSRSEVRDSLQKQVKIRGSALKTILNEHNLGIAKALNQGFALAIQLGYEYLITLDQDSIPVAGMRDALLAAYQSHPNRRKLAVLGPDIVEKSLGKPSRYIRSKGPLFFERVACSGRILRNILFVITSGSMHSLELYQAIGAFRDDFFIDAVDTEHCLRAIQKGYEISVACNAALEHNLGNRQQRHLLGSRQSPTFHPPSRWYYISRNRIVMIFLYGWHFPQWFSYEIVVSITGLMRMLLFENQRVIKIKAVVLGTWHGLTHKLGEMPLEVRKSLVAP